jgi:DeoR/GlpR family transcriptional regulator of sugar metabolism
MKDIDRINGGMRSVNADQRRQFLLQLVQSRGFASLPDLVSHLGVSESTVRRDLDILEESGEVKRTHGGVYYAGPSPNLPHFRQRQEAEWDKKKAIARVAAELIEDGDTLLLDGGSTTYELARLLLGRPLQIVTSSLPVANLFNTDASIDLIIIGGYVHARTGSVQGPYANEMLSSLHVRRTVISTAGINERGIFNTNRLLAETQRAMMAATDEVIVVADSTKFGHQSLALVCELNSISKLVVDSHISNQWRDQIGRHEVDLVIADMPAQDANSEG